jgi:hypothetical protein
MSQSGEADGELLRCIHCPLARFPGPREQCYKFGGLICTVDNANVGKYERCRFGYRRERAEPTGRG